MAAKESPKTLDAYIASMNKQVGFNVMDKASIMLRDPVRVPSGIFALDYATGGGLPLWQMSCYFGPESSGKTTAGLRAVGSIQSMCWCCHRHLDLCECNEPKKMNALWVNLESDLDLAWAEAHGVDLDRFFVATPYSGEQAFNLINKAVNVQDCGIIVVDSLANILSEYELSNDDALYSQQPGIQAKLIAKQTRLLQSIVNHEKVSADHPFLILFINQVREKIGQLYGDPEYMPGGRAFRHLIKLGVRFGNVSLKPEVKKKFTIDGKVIASRHTIKIVKKNLAIFQETGEYVVINEDVQMLDLRKGTVQDYKTVIKLAIDYGILAGTSGKYTYLEYEFKNKDEFKAFLIQNPCHYFAVKKTILEERRRSAGLQIDTEDTESCIFPEARE